MRSANLGGKKENKLYCRISVKYLVYSREITSIKKVICSWAYLLVVIRETFSKRHLWLMKLPFTYNALSVEIPAEFDSYEEKGFLLKQVLNALCNVFLVCVCVWEGWVII